MTKKNIIYILFFSCLFFKEGFSQDSLLVNGELKTNDCAKINIAEYGLEINRAHHVKIYHAEITNNCLALGIIYPKGKSNIELITDNHLIEGATLSLNFVLYYLETNTTKAINKTTIYFDLTPFKNSRTGQYLVINILGESYQLIYK